MPCSAPRIRTGKRVRSETALGSNPASVSSVALDLATRELGDLTKKNILVIGMGEMGTLTQKLLRAQGARNVVLVNRTLDRARSLAEPDWTARPMEELPSALADADLVISATSAPHAIVTAQDLKLAAGARFERFYRHAKPASLAHHRLGAATRRGAQGVRNCGRHPV